LRPPPAGAGAPTCLLHQTMPATASTARTVVRTSHRRDRGLAICEGPIEGSSLRVLIGWFMNLPSVGVWGGLGAVPQFVVWAALEVLRPRHLNDSASCCRINNRKELHFSVQHFSVQNERRQPIGIFVRFVPIPRRIKGQPAIFCTYPGSATRPRCNAESWCCIRESVPSKARWPCAGYPKESPRLPLKPRAPETGTAIALSGVPLGRLKLAKGLMSGRHVPQSG
jgi:hypothetical protein